MVVANVFSFNRVKESGIYTVQSDVYSFGVFLIELVSGREARVDQSIIQLVRLLFYHNSFLYVTRE
jgi:serine/threonine protein kinase